MAFIKCPVCGRRISENASTCPYCGYPISAVKNTRGTRRRSILGIIGGLLVIIAFAAISPEKFDFLGLFGGDGIASVKFMRSLEPTGDVEKDAQTIKELIEQNKEDELTDFMEKVQEYYEARGKKGEAEMAYIFEEGIGEENFMRLNGIPEEDIASYMGDRYSKAAKGKDDVNASPTKDGGQQIRQEGNYITNWIVDTWYDSPSSMDIAYHSTIYHFHDNSTFECVITEELDDDDIIKKGTFIVDGNMLILSFEDGTEQSLRMDESEYLIYKGEKAYYAVESLNSIKFIGGCSEWFYSAKWERKPNIGKILYENDNKPIGFEVTEYANNTLEDVIDGKGTPTNSIRLIAKDRKHLYDKDGTLVATIAEGEFNGSFTLSGNSANWYITSYGCE